MTKTRAYTLVEMILVLAIFIFIFGAVVSIMLAGNRNWRAGQNIIIEQQEARKAMDNIASRLRQSSPSWNINGTLYPVTITSGNRIDFYQPQGNATSTVLEKVTYKLNPDNTTQLLRKVGAQDAVVVANYINNLSFAWECSGCSVVSVGITTQKENLFNLTSEVFLRNANASLSADTQVDEPLEGEIF